MCADTFTDTWNHILRLSLSLSLRYVCACGHMEAGLKRCTFYFEFEFALEFEYTSKQALRQ